MSRLHSAAQEPVELISVKEVMTRNRQRATQPDSTSKPKPSPNRPSIEGRSEAANSSFSKQMMKSRVSNPKKYSLKTGSPAINKISTSMPVTPVKPSNVAAKMTPEKGAKTS